MARVYRQAAVVPVRFREDRTEICLVTTLRGKRWVVPKGSVDRGELPHEAAARETEEEAGLLGSLDPRSLGRYQFDRDGDRYSVEVYLMHVTAQLDYWQEAEVRERRWLSIDDAADLVRPELRSFVLAVRGRARSLKLLTLGTERHLLSRETRR